MAVRRDWSLARAKVEAEGRCRVCLTPPGPGVRLEAAHVAGRQHDQRHPQLGVLVVAARDVVPLCIKGGLAGCHTLYDSRRLDLLPYLTLDEQAAAAGHLGLVGALRRTTGSRDATHTGGDVV